MAMLRDDDEDLIHQYGRKAVQYRSRAQQLAAIAGDNKHPHTKDQFRQLSVDYLRLAQQMEELGQIELRLHSNRGRQTSSNSLAG